MPRPKKPGAPEPKRRSRNGCWPCKTRKVKCDETKPSCNNCSKQNETCDYSIRLNWDGRGKKKTEEAPGLGQAQFMLERQNPDTTALVGAYPTGLSQFQSNVYINHATSQTGLGHIPTYHNDSPTPEILPTETLPTENPMADASLNPLGLNGFLQGSLPVQQQSYERYRSPASTYGMTSPVKMSGTSTDLDSASGLYGSPLVHEFDASLAKSPHVHLATDSQPYVSEGALGDDTTILEHQSPDGPRKRARYHTLEGSAGSNMLPPPASASINAPPLRNFELQSSINIPQTAHLSAGTPLTPSSNNSDEGQRLFACKTASPRIDPPDLRRLSVNSLLSGPPGIQYRPGSSHTPRSNSDSLDWSIQYHDLYTDTTTYGIDRGLKDLDIGLNDDANAISGPSPSAMRGHFDLVLNEDDTPVEFGFGTKSYSPAVESLGYYDKPVPICIPKLLEPLPSKLLENPMNLLYFHHFINHTAGALLPHNCSSNPFRLILPQMAVRDDNLLSLLLAYSASHRARLLRQPEPATRIALWVQGIFTKLRKALDDPSEIISNVNLATAIMLASLEIISPKAFGVAVSWQQHLSTAREMIAARGGPLRMKTASRGDKVSSFLWSWFAYLDVLGSLSGGKLSSIPSAWTLDDIEDENDYVIDCILGFTSKCIRLLAKIAELARVCDLEKGSAALAENLNWNPSDQTTAIAEKLIIDLTESLARPAQPCTHLQSSGEAAYQWDSLEMTATNEAFHWAGLVHLHRRILGKPSAHADVQNAVCEIFGSLNKIRKGSSAEACLLFPMFTAGCDSQDAKQRVIILERIKSIERYGMMQINQARKLMEKTWETGKPWEALAAGEFFG